MLSPRARDIRAAVHGRGIGEVLHFTQLQNLEDIVAHGFLPRSMIEDRTDVTAYVVEEERRDGEDRAVSVSVSAFNHEMFAAKRGRSGGLPWVVLAIDPRILWTHECRFHATNVLSREARRRQGSRGHVWAFQELFEETSYGPGGFRGSRYRAETSIPPNFATDPAAEVQVMEPFGSDLITEAWIDRADLADPVREILGRLPGGARPLHVAPFEPRWTNGHAHWG